MSRPPIRTLLSPLILAGAVACSDALGPEDLRGAWGSESALLSVGPTEAILEASCFVGRFPVPARIRDDGIFEVDGATTHQGGAPPLEPPQPQPATFAGIIRGDHLVLLVNPGALGSEPYLLRRGVRLDIPRCP